MPIGHQIGLISEGAFHSFCERKALKEAEIKRVMETFLPPSEGLNAALAAAGTAPISGGARLCDLIRRPQVTYDMLAPFDAHRPALPQAVREKVEIEIKYEGYIARQRAQVAEMLRLEGRRLPPDIDYSAVYGLRLEAAEKLMRVRPANIGQASRISGVSPADISVLLIYLEKNRQKEQTDDNL